MSAPAPDASWTFEPIAVVRSCFKEKFGIPRQPGLAPHAMGTLKFKKSTGYSQALKSLEGFSHLWVIFVFHEHGAKNWKPTIRPPRLGGAKRVGVFASRTPHRPNPIGISVVKILDIRPNAKGGAEIDVEGVDLLDGTPVLDIKPYVAYCDSVPEAKSSWATDPLVDRVELKYSALALKKIKTVAVKIPTFAKLVDELMSLDPRPAFQRKDPPGGHYGFRIMDWDVKFTAQKGYLAIEDLLPFEKLNAVKKQNSK